MTMKNSTICLISSIICFSVGVLIFGLALFARIFDPEVAGAIGLILMIAFLVLSMLTIMFRNREREEEGKKE